MSVGAANLTLEPRSLLDDKVVDPDITLDGPEITFETDLTLVNLKKILSNIEEATGGGGKSSTPDTNQPAPAKPSEGKKLEVDNFLIKNAKVHVSVNAPLIGQQSAERYHS